MRRGISLKKIWSDADMIEARITTSDGTSSFTSDIYIGHPSLEEAVTDLTTFKAHVHGGLLDLRFGESGPEYAGGAFHARFHFPKPGHLFVTCRQQSSFEDFTFTKVASEATLYLKTEPALLDRFIDELRDVSTQKHDEAYLEAI
jgi:hypothetical protein